MPAPLYSEPEEEWRQGRRPNYLAMPAEAAETASLVPERPLPPARRWGLLRVALLLVATATVGALAATARSSTRSPLRKRLGAAIQRYEMRGTVACDAMEEGVEYVVRAKTEVGEYENIDQAALCRYKCFAVPECTVWTWVGKTGQCILKRLEQDEVPHRHAAEGTTSGGMPCQMESTNAPGSLYCFALMLPDTYEKDLLAMQYYRKTSLFGCDEYAVISNSPITLVDGVVAQVVDNNLKCEKGGEFGTALNLYIFIAVWKQVVASGRFRYHDWTVKSDPDAVFIPARLRALLPHHPEEGRGVYLNNCKFGMHGPLEVFSRNAVEALSGGWDRCLAHFTEVCSGDCQWGEDMFIDQCLEKVINVRRDNEWSLLVEDHCFTMPKEEQPQWSYYLCDGQHVAFHPFKEQSNYDQCLSNAMAMANQPQAPPTIDSDTASAAAAVDAASAVDPSAGSYPWQWDTSDPAAAAAAQYGAAPYGAPATTGPYGPPATAGTLAPFYREGGAAPYGPPATDGTLAPFYREGSAAPYGPPATDGTLAPFYREGAAQPMPEPQPPMYGGQPPMYAGADAYGPWQGQWPMAGAA